MNARRAIENELAARLGLTRKEAALFPLVVERAALAMKTPPYLLCRAIEGNAELRQHLIDVTRQVAQEVTP